MEADLLWSDFDDCVEDYEENVARGSGFVLGCTATENFLKGCGFTKIVRSHQSVEGYDWVFGSDGGCVTVFSAVDYMETANDGAVALLKMGGGLEMRMFHPVIAATMSRWRPIWPVWLVEQPEVSKKVVPTTGGLRRFVSEPIGEERGSIVGIEIKM
jgi:hypothetical protein